MLLLAQQAQNIVEGELLDIRKDQIWNLGQGTIKENTKNNSLEIRDCGGAINKIFEHRK